MNATVCVVYECDTDRRNLVDHRRKRQTDRQIREQRSSTQVYGREGDPQETPH